MAADKSKSPKRARQSTESESKPPVLAQVRERIDAIDQQIQSLIAERAQFALQVGKAKGKLAAAVDYYRPEREAQVLRMVVDRNQGPLSDESAGACSGNHVRVSGAARPLKIGYLGPEGTFSQQAVLKHFGRSACAWPAAVEHRGSIPSGSGQRGFLTWCRWKTPGRSTIQVTLDMFLLNLKSSPRCRTARQLVLMSRSRPDQTSERIYAHPQSFAQTAGWLRANCRRSKRFRYPATPKAHAVRSADSAAAIGGESAAHVYGLKKVIMKPIQRRQGQHHALPRGRPQHLSAVRPRPHLRAGVHPRQTRRTVRRASPFARHGISMNRIESRPSHNAKWEYAFFIDLAGHVDNEAMKLSLPELAAHAATVVFGVLSGSGALRAGIRDG
ncbi:MAG: chorismate mutase [Lysobacteraceae bacterium]